MLDPPKQIWYSIQDEIEESIRQDEPPFKPLIRLVHEALPDVLLCAGNVLTKDQVDRAMNAGAAAIVSPGLNPEIVRYCISKNIPVCPGTENPSDIEQALSLVLEVRHIGINSGNPEKAMQDVQMLSQLMEWPVQEGDKSIFCGTGFEMMKIPFRGTNGHVAIACSNIYRAKFHLELRGFIFEDESTASMKNGNKAVIYLKDEIAGFAFHLAQK